MQQQSTPLDERRRGIHERVNKGAYFLDRVAPGRLELVDATQVSFVSPFLCPVGAGLGRPRAVVLDHVPMTFEDMQIRGFAARDESTYDELRKAWVAIIVFRQLGSRLWLPT